MYDCSGACISDASAVCTGTGIFAGYVTCEAWKGDGACNSAGGVGPNLNCAANDFDGGDCRQLPLGEQLRGAPSRASHRVHRALRLPDRGQPRPRLPEAESRAPEDGR